MTRMRITLHSFLAVGLLAPSPAVARGASEWREVRLDTGDSSISAAAFDDRLGRFLVVLDDFDTATVDIAAYEPGRPEPIWRTTIAEDPRTPVYYPAHTSARAILVRSERHLAYVGGGTLFGNTQTGMSVRFVYALDTRTGKVAWSHIDTLHPGFGTGYYNLAEGPDGSVVAVGRTLIGAEQSSSGSYAPHVVSLGAAGDVRWRWADTNAGLVTDAVSTKTGVLAVVGDTYVNGWARSFRLGLDAATGALRWRRVMTTHAESWSTIAPSGNGRMLYVAGSATNDARRRHGGSRAPVRALEAKTGRIRWTRHIGRLGSTRSWDTATKVIATPLGPCVTGRHSRGSTPDYKPILPDNGFVVCYSRTGKRRWIDRRAGAAGQVLHADGSRLLWAGRQEIARYESSYDLMRYAIRSLKNGKIRESRDQTGSSYIYTPSEHLLAEAHHGTAQFLTTISQPRGLFNRSFR